MLDTKSKNKYSWGILAMLIVAALCSAGMLSTYRLVAEDMEEVSSERYITREA